MSNTPATLAVGKEVLAYCTQCKMDLAHTIASMKGDKAAKVECKTCKKTHVFRAPKGITEPPPKKKKKATAAEAAAVSVENEWERLMQQSAASPQKSYSTKGNFKIGDKIAHSSFGQGFVGKLIYPNKIEVIFRNEIKVLIHAGPPPVTV